MSRFTATVLLSVVMLGILLWIVVSTVAELANPEPLVVLVEDEEPPAFDPALPVIDSGGGLAAWLEARHMDKRAALASVAGFRVWLMDRGYPANDWLADGMPATGPMPLPDDDVALMTLAGAGDADAALELGARSINDDPVAALDWYDQAIVNGSIYAMLRTSDLLQSLGDPALAGFRSNPVWQQALAEINTQTATPDERALAWSIAAVIVGGYAVLDGTHAARLSRLAERLDAAALSRACNLAQDYVLDTAQARRARGGAVFSDERPLFAVSVANPAERVPCDVPVVPLVNLGDCISESFVGPGPELWQMHFCPSR